MSWQCLVCLNKNVCPEATTDLVSIVNDMAKMDANLKPPCEAYEPGCEGKEKNSMEHYSLICKYHSDTTTVCWNLKCPNVDCPYISFNDAAECPYYEKSYAAN